MRLLLDLNVVLDVLLAREEFRESSELLLAVSEGSMEAFIPLHAISTIYYFLRKEMSDAESRAQLSKLLDIVHIISITESSVRRAITSSIADFEDAIVSETAIEIEADYIITRNERDFRQSRVKPMSPRDFVYKYL